MMCWVKGTAVDMPLVVWWEVMAGGGVFNGSMIRSQSVSETVPLDCELHTCLLHFSTSVGQDVYSGPRLGISLPPG